MRGVKNRKSTVFDLYHPVVAFAYFVAVLVFCMAAFHPVYLAITLSAGIALSICLRGWRATLRTAAWQLPLLVIVALANPLFSASGSTELFRIGLRAVYLESLAFGLCMGAMLVSAMIWFSHVSSVLTTDKVMALFGNIAPVAVLMFSSAVRLVPQYVQRGGEISTVQQAMSAAKPPKSAKDQVKQRIRQVSVLMGWSMESSLETVDAMRARGWGSALKRTTYKRHRFRRRDGAALTVLAALAGVSAVLAIAALAGYSFYPTMPPLALWWGYVPYAALLFMPLAAQIVEDVRWR